MERRRKPSPNWTALPEEILLNILSRHKDDFLFRLAAMGVCKEWRACSRWVDSITFRSSELATRICNKHGKDLLGCGCVCDSLSGIISRSYGLRKVEFLDESQYGWSFHGQGLKVLKMKGFFTDSTLEMVVGMCRSLEHLEIEELGCGFKNPMLNAPNLRVLRLKTPFCSTLKVSAPTFKVSAPRLRDVYLDGVDNFVTEGTSLQELTMVSAPSFPPTLTFTGMINLQKLSLVVRDLCKLWTRELFLTVAAIKIKCLSVVAAPVRLPMLSRISVCELFGGFKELEEVAVDVNILRELSQTESLENRKLETIQSITIDLSGAGYQDSFRCISDLLSLCPNARRLALKGNSEDFRKWLKLHLAVDEKFILVNASMQA